MTNLKSQLYHQIEKLDDDEKSLSRVLEFVYALTNPDNNTPFINDEFVGEYIKEDSNIIVPVICDDMFVYVKDNGIYSLGDFICEKYSGRIDGETAMAIKSNFYFGMSLLEQGKNRSHAIYSLIEEGINTNNIQLRQSVVEFLTKGDFPLIITTFSFPLLERTLFQKEYSSEWFTPHRRNDLPFMKDGDSRVVYHIFGGRTPDSWVYNEQTLLKFLHALHDGDYSAKSLSNYLRGTGRSGMRRPLVLGASLPDWLFRFFIYPLYGEKIKEANGYWLSLSDIEKSLDLFLNRNNYLGQTNLCKDNRMDSIMAKATADSCGTKHQGSKILRIFVSYKREDIGTPKAKILERIIEILQKQGVVWLDVEKVSDAGNPYWESIKSAVRDCDIFIPLVTSRYLEEFRDASDIELYAKETPMEIADGNIDDNETIKALKPVIREAFYALLYKKKCAPIVVYDEKEKLNEGKVEGITMNNDDSRNLPKSVFGERTLLLHDDETPKFFNLPKID